LDKSIAIGQEALRRPLAQRTHCDRIVQMQQDVTTRSVAAEDADAVSKLHARVFGPGRFARTAYRVREGTGQRSAFCRLALVDGTVIAALRMTPVTIGETPGALLLGPLAVHPDYANQGHGRRLIAESLDAARSHGVSLVVLVGDESYYARLGFVPVPPGQMWLRGPVDPARILALELTKGALTSFRGLIAGSNPENAGAST